MADKKKILVPGARIELATPAFSGRRSTSELPRHANNFSSLGASPQPVNSPGIFCFCVPCFNTNMSTTSQESVSIVAELDKLASSAAGSDALMNSIVSLLHEKLTRYNWVGFYMIDEKNPSMLVLGPFRGSMTPHTRIPLNQGICGAAASSGQTVIVDDVNNDPRYLACSLETKSEIVVPVFVKGKVIGELDIDSHFLAAFGPDDRKLCEHAAVLVGKFIESRS
jgi:L-methionine (R)-S-oxide reductase